MCIHFCPDELLAILGILTAARLIPAWVRAWVGRRKGASNGAV